MTTFARNTKRIMKEKGITWKMLQERTGFSKGSIYNWLSGDYFPNLQYVYEIAEALGVSPKELIGESK